MEYEHNVFGTTGTPYRAASARPIKPTKWPTKKSPGLCQWRKCTEWATTLVRSGGLEIILCDTDWDGYRRSQQQVFGDKWSSTLEYVEFNGRAAGGEEPPVVESPPAPPPQPEPKKRAKRAKPGAAS